jgi:hypothetical protein
MDTFEICVKTGTGAINAAIPTAVYGIIGSMPDASNLLLTLPSVQNGCGFHCETLDVDSGMLSST